jgi:hypothetical protein
MIFVLLLLVWAFLALLVAMAFGAICETGSDTSEAPFPATQDPNIAIRGHTHGHPPFSR